VLRRELVSGLIYFNSQRVEKATDSSVQPSFSLQAVEQVGLTFELDAQARGEVLRHRLTELAELDQCRVGVGGENILGGRAKLREEWRVPGKKTEVPGMAHDCRSVVFV
jgi:hypothetical protein